MSLDINVKTIGRDDRDFSEYKKMIFQLLDNNLSNEKLKGNYTVEEMKMNEAVGLSVYETDNGIVGFSTVIFRPHFKNCTRILNRFFKTDEYRSYRRKVRKNAIVSKETRIMVQQQLELTLNEGFDFAFMSRETKKTTTNLNHYYKYLDFTDWYIPQGKFLVCDEGIESSTCWQNIIHTKCDVIHLPSMTEEEFNEKYEL